MYCIDCGTQNLDTTRYCKSCGANLESLRMALTQPLSSEAVSMIGPRHVGVILILSGFVGVGGFAVVAGMLIALASTIGPSLGNGLLPLLLFLGMAGFAGVSFIVWSLMRMLRTGGRALPTGPLPQQPQLPVGNSHVLPSARFQDHVPGSVVDHTTARLRDYAPPRPEERER